MKKIPLRNRKGKIRAYALVDDEDYERVTAEGIWHYTSGSKGKSYAAHGQMGVPNFLLHNFILGRKGIDHKNGNGLDCQKDNLRDASNSQNLANQGKHSNNKSGFKGVSWHKGARKWYAQICVYWKVIHLGSFDNPIAAAKAYDTAAKEFFGEFARPNFPMRFPRLWKKS
jgi:hypothetical protein